MNLDNTFLDFPDEIQRVEKHIRESVNGGCDLLREVAGYIQLGGGKKLRPRLVILVARALAPSNALAGHADGRMDMTEAAVRAGAAAEMVHLASLLHDDVIDKATMRRGKPSVNERYGDDVAILMADLLYSRAFDLALSALNCEVTRLLCRATQSMCESEVFQIELRNSLLTEEQYNYIIGSKTAALFSACAEVGGVLAGATSEQRAALSEFGKRIGVAYQITDDVLDYVATGEKWGKPHGNDLAQGKQTLPVVYACAKADPADREELLSQLRNGRDMAKVLPVIEKTGGLDYAAGRARNLAGEAESLIPVFQANASEPLFRKICRYAVERTY